MIKKIDIRELRPGMYVHDLNCSWVAHPLYPTRFKVQSGKEVDKLVELGVSSVYIDSGMGDDAPNAATEDEVRLTVEAALLKIAESPGAKGAAQGITTREELASAAQIHREAHQTIQEVMSDIRLGKHSEMESIEPAIRGVVDSVFRNSGALIQLGGIRTKDQYTFAHSVNVCALLTSFARTLKLGNDITRQISVGGMLHDIGKMRVPDAILNKPDRLTESEFDEMRQHVQQGVDILDKVSWISPISLQVTAQHHERYDGSGYPGGLKGDQISQFGQMASIVDVYDAITSVRVYHRPMAPVMAIRKIQEWSGQYFNEELVSHFIRSVGIFPLGTLVRLESDLLAIVVEHSGASLLNPVVRVVYDTGKRSRVEPYDLDLSRQSADRIVGFESGEKWGIAPADFLTIVDIPAAR
ncbi:MAG: HD-GYP domain-containing protein [Gallionella sp.]|nr:HD-GYP domain-containing protein [Gallionella sp.]MCK9354305.1 HD-GYP domain-containing protein [Gallionella sp.]